MGAFKNAHASFWRVLCATAAVAVARALVVVAVVVCGKFDEHIW